MKRSFEVALASALTLLIAACASLPGGSAAPAGGQAGGAGSAVASAAGQGGVRDFNLQVKCPGVAYLKKQGWSDEQILTQLNMEQYQIPACVEWVESQPKGFVPPPPGGAPAPAEGEKAAGQKSS